MSQRSAMRPDEAALGDRALAAGGLAFELAKKWWVLLLRGILLIIIGLLAFVSPLTWVIFVGIYMLIDGITMLMSGFSDQPAGQSRWPLLILGILGLIAGLIILWDPELGGVTLTYVIAAWAVVGGILTIISAIRVREEIDNEWWLVLSGILADHLRHPGLYERPGRYSDHRLGVRHFRHRGGHPLDRAGLPGA